MNISDTITSVFEIMSEGIVIIDSKACIVYANKAYCNFLGMMLEDISGIPLRNIRPGARLPNVLITRAPILQAPRQESDNNVYFANMYPIFQGIEVVGGISVVTFVEHAQGFQRLLEQIKQHNKQIISRLSKGSAQYSFDDIIAASPSSKRIKKLALRAAATDATVLLQSESGTGKELYAQAIHNAGSRSGNIFLSLNCANFNSNILESELFGYVGGAFTQGVTVDVVTPSSCDQKQLLPHSL